MTDPIRGEPQIMAEETTSECISVPELHRRTAATAVRCVVVTVSDTRTLETDRGGQVAVELLQKAGHHVVDRAIVPDDVEQIRAKVNAVLQAGKAQVILLTGGTGLSSRDQTVEALRPLTSKEIPGFGELFRMLSFQEIGPAAMLSRAFAGVMGKVAVFALPGSPAAVQLALEKLILPELGHLLAEVAK